MLPLFHIWVGLTSSAPSCPKRYFALVHCYRLYALHEIRYLQILKIFILKTAIKLCVITFSAWLWKLHYSICQWSFPSWRHISNSCCSNTSDFLDVQHSLQTQRNTPASVLCVLRSTYRSDGCQNSCTVAFECQVCHDWKLQTTINLSIYIMLAFVAWKN